MKKATKDEWPPEVAVDLDAFESVTEAARRGRRLERTMRKRGDWRDNILGDLPEGPVQLRGTTFTSALEIIKIAAYNRRMHLDEYVGRAALAMAVADLGLDWAEVTDKEMPMRDLRRHKLPARRLRGRGFGPWRIKGLE